MKNILIGLLLGLIGGALGFYAEHQAAAVRAEALAERQTQQLALDGSKDLTATLVADCGRVLFVQFIKRNGMREIVQIPEMSHAGGVRARVQRIDPKRVNTLLNTRPCQDSSL